MKKLITGFLTLLLLCAVVCVLPAQAEATTDISGEHEFIDEPAAGEKIENADGCIDELSITYIKEVSVWDIDAPVAGAKPDYTCAWSSASKYMIDTKYETAGSKIGVVWFNDTKGTIMDPHKDVFEAENVYRVRTHVKTTGDGVFNTKNGEYDLICKINGNTVSPVKVNGTADPNLMAMDYTFRPVSHPDITTLTVTGVDAPATGERPDIQFIIPENAGYKITNIVWKNVETGATVSKNATFEGGQQYQVRIFLATVGNVQFKADGITGTVNGQPGKILRITGVDSRKELCLTYTFPAAVGNIYSASVQIKAPVTGEKPDYNAVIPGIQNYQVYAVPASGYKYGVGWINSTAGFLMDADDTFKANNQYTVVIALKAKEGSQFYTDTDGNLRVVVTINGMKAEVSGTPKNILVSAHFEKLAGTGVPVQFTADSSKRAGNIMTVDIEAMAETDEELMEAYLNSGVTYKWYLDEGFTGDTRASIELKHSWVGKRVYVKVFYGDKSSTSERFVVEPGISAIRIAGKDRATTARLTADELKSVLGVEKFSAILYTSGKEFADALAGSHLSSRLNAPVLLYSNASAAANLTYMKNNLYPGGTVYILGGTAPIPESVETDLKAAGLNVKRLSGSNRFQTNIAILKEAGFNGGKVLICTSRTFADSLSASATGLPIMLVNKNWTELSADYKNYFSTITGKCEFYIIGGADAVNVALENSLKAYGTVVRRFAGATRYETSTMIASYFFKKPEKAVLAYGKNFPDGLAGGALANALDVPLVLTLPTKYSAAKAYTGAYQIASGYVLGGSGLIDDATVREIFRMGTGAEIKVIQ